jgi:hypothetical protein
MRCVVSEMSKAWLSKHTNASWLTNAEAELYRRM